MVKQVHQGQLASSDVEAALQKISEASTVNLSNAENVKNASHKQLSSIDTLVKNFENMVVNSEEMTSGAQHVDKSSDELRKVARELSQATQTINEIFSKLEAGLNKFHLG